MMEEFKSAASLMILLFSRTTLRRGRRRLDGSDWKDIVEVS